MARRVVRRRRRWRRQDRQADKQCRQADRQTRPGAVLNFLALFDDFLVSRTKAMAKDVQTHLWPHAGFDELEQSKIEELNYEHYTLHAPAEESELPLKWNEAAPCALRSLLIRCVCQMRGRESYSEPG